MITALFSGFGVGAGLIIAIGAQNAFVLGQGLRRHHHIMVACVCALCDAVLISLGIAGLGRLISASPLWTDIMAWGGAAFLGWYGLQALRSAFSDHRLKKDKSHGRSRRDILLFTLAVTLLNPHVYIDTIVLLGSVAAQFPRTEQMYFGVGAVLASFTWFATLSIGAAWASPYLARPLTWKIIDASTGIVMWTVAVSLLI